MAFASNPLMADDGAFGDTNSGRHTPESHSLDGFLCVANDDYRPASPGNASTSSTHSRCSSSTSSAWRRNNPYNLRRRGSEDHSRDSDRSPAHSSRHPAGGSHDSQHHHGAAAASASAGSFGNGSHTAVEGFIFDVSNISIADEGQALLRKSSSSWTSSSSTFDKASGRVLERSSNDAATRGDSSSLNATAHDPLGHASPTTWGGSYDVGLGATANGGSLGVRGAQSGSDPLAPPPPTDRIGVGSVGGAMSSGMNPFLVNEANLVPAHRPPSSSTIIGSPTSSAPPSLPSPSKQPNVAVTGPHSATDGPFEYFPAGLMITVFAPNNSQAQAQHIPSDRILRTSGASNVYQVLLCAQKQRDEKLAEVYRVTGKMPATIPPVKQPHSLKPKHCAHFQFKKVCNLGSGCNFIHAMLPQQQQATPTPQQGAATNSSSRVQVDTYVGPPPPPPAMHQQQQQPPLGPMPQAPLPPPHYTHQAQPQLPQPPSHSFTVAPNPVDPHNHMMQTAYMMTPQHQLHTAPLPRGASSLTTMGNGGGGYYTHAAPQPQQQMTSGGFISSNGGMQFTTAAPQYTQVQPAMPIMPQPHHVFNVTAQYHQPLPQGLQPQYHVQQHTQYTHQQPQQQQQQQYYTAQPTYQQPTW